MVLYLNGRWLDAAAAAVPVRDAGFLHGDGVFETARLHRGGYFRLGTHLERLRQGGDLLRLTVPPADHLVQIARELIGRNGLEEGTLRIVLTRGGAAGPTLLVTLEPIALDWQQRAARGWRIITARTRRPPVESIPAQLKTIGRVHSLLARAERPDGIDDVLLLTVNGDVCEGPSWSIFWRKGDLLRTPSAAAGALEGVTSATILDLAPGHGFAVEAGVWPRAELDTADEVFATMSSLGVVSVRELDGRTLRSDRAAHILQQTYWSKVAAETKAEQGTDRA